MKKSLLALAALASVAGAASAQSSVTLSGSVDLGVRRVGAVAKDGSTTTDTSLTPAASSRSAITFSGTEDLGGGMKAFFLLNYRFLANNGTINPGGNAGPANTTQFWRNAWVGLGGGFGDVRLGRMLMPLQEFNGGYEPWDGGDTVGNVHTGGIGATVRANNAIYYRSPSFGGVEIHAAVASAKGQTNGQIDADNNPLTPTVLGDNSGDKKPVGLGVRFTGGPVSVALAYDRTDKEVKTLGLYGKYNFGVGTALAQFERGDTGPDTDKVKRWSLGGLFPVGAAVIKVGYTRWKDEEIRKLGVGVDYNLSKRTSLYSDLGKVGGDAATDAAKKVMFDVGLRHKF